MEALKERIRREGQGLGCNILRVDSFLNHQIDTAFVEEMGRELARRFKETKPTKILTVESSGIPLACAVSAALGHLPVVFAKKAAPNTMAEGVYSTDIKSFTKETVSTIRVCRDFLQPGERILIVDDFLAYGESALGLARLVRSAKGETVGVGVAIEKQFQGGSAKLREEGYRVEALAVVQSIQEGDIEFAR